MIKRLLLPIIKLLNKICLKLTKTKGEDYMSYHPIKLDKVRNFKYGMKAINLIEKKYGKPIMEIDGIEDGKITMEDYANLIWAGLAHEDPELTPEKVMDLVDEYSSIAKVSKIMWQALNDVFKDVEGETENKDVKVKNKK